MFSRSECEAENEVANGAAALNLRIGDIRIALVSVDPELTMAVQGAHERFLVNDDAADARVSAAWGELRHPAGDRIFDSGGLWQLYRRNADLLFHFTSPVFGTLPYKTACFNGDFTSGEVFLYGGHFQRNEPIYPLEYPLDELLIMHLLANGRGAEVHACGAVDSDGQGLLFLGQSGAGKTTMARLLTACGAGPLSRGRPPGRPSSAGQREPAGGPAADQGVRPTKSPYVILSDDRIILRYLDNRLWIYGTPWHGEGGFATPARAPLKQIFFLGRGQRNEVVPLREAAAVARLMACSFVPFYSPGGLDFTLAFFEQVTQAVPCSELRFVPDGRVVDFLQHRMLNEIGETK